MRRKTEHGPNVVASGIDERVTGHRDVSDGDSSPVQPVEEALSTRPDAVFALRKGDPQPHVVPIGPVAMTTASHNWYANQMPRPPTSDVPGTQAAPEPLRDPRTGVVDLAVRRRRRSAA